MTLALLSSVARPSMANLPQANWEWVTPEIAAGLLMNNPHNRNLRANIVKAHAEAMLNGNFCGDNGETIKVSTTGELLDGQHRLSGIVEAKVGAILLVVRGIRPEVVPTIDVGVKKSVADILSMDGEACSNDLAAALSRLHAIRNGITLVGSQHIIPAYQSKQLLAAEPGIKKSVEDMLKVRSITSVSLCAAFHYIFSVDKGHKAIADKFFEDLATGENLAANDPVYVLRERLLRARTSKYRLSLDELSTFIVNAWNARFDNVPLKVLRGKIKSAHGKKVDRSAGPLPPIKG